jgi:hypothetical protein
VLEHFVDTLVEILDVLVRVVGECVTRGSPPDQLLGSRIEEIDNYSATLYVSDVVVASLKPPPPKRHQPQPPPNPS